MNKRTSRQAHKDPMPPHEIIDEKAVARIREDDETAYFVDPYLKMLEKAIGVVRAGTKAAIDFSRDLPDVKSESPTIKNAFRPFRCAAAMTLEIDDPFCGFRLQALFNNGNNKLASEFWDGVNTLSEMCRPIIPVYKKLQGDWCTSLDEFEKSWKDLLSLLNVEFDDTFFDEFETIAEEDNNHIRVAEFSDRLMDIKFKTLSKMEDIKVMPAYIKNEMQSFFEVIFEAEQHESTSIPDLIDDIKTASNWEGRFAGIKPDTLERYYRQWKGLKHPETIRPKRAKGKGKRKRTKE